MMSGSLAAAEIAARMTSNEARNVRNIVLERGNFCEGIAEFGKRVGLGEEDVVRMRLEHFLHHFGRGA